MNDVKRPSLVKPTLETPFHIDFNWWQQNDREWSVYLRGLLGPEQEARLESIEEGARYDWVDPDTAEVQQVGGLHYLLMEHFAANELAEEGVTLVEAIFRIFLRNGNSPLTATQLGEMLERPANTILRTLSGTRVYRGLRPIIG
ncbi:MAG: hypothetical protein DWG76_08275 [Chloroflexi bacterium]|nr:hypothetical protein [Chloroflexota bacterium]